MTVEVLIMRKGFAEAGIPQTEVLERSPADTLEFVVAPDAEQKEETAVPEQGKSFAIFKARPVVEALKQSKLFDELDGIAIEQSEKEALENVSQAVFDYGTLSDGFIGIDFATKEQKKKRGNIEIPLLAFYKDAKSTPLEQSVLEKQKLETAGVYGLPVLEVFDGLLDVLSKAGDIEEKEKALVLELAEKTFNKDAKLRMKLETTSESKAFIGHTALQMPRELTPEEKSDWSISRTRHVHYYGPVLKPTEVRLVRGGET